MNSDSAFFIIYLPINKMQYKYLSFTGHHLIKLNQPVYFNLGIKTALQWRWKRLMVTLEEYVIYYIKAYPCIGMA